MSGRFISARLGLICSSSFGLAASILMEDLPLARSDRTQPVQVHPSIELARLCVVNAPSTAQLNARSEPKGDILTTLGNGEEVNVIGRAKAKPFVNITGAADWSVYSNHLRWRGSAETANRERHDEHASA